MRRNLPIRVRLTLWYSSILAVSFAVLSLGAYLAIAESVKDALDKDLKDRLKGLNAFLAAGLRADEQPAPDGSLLRVCDASGAPVYESAAMKRRLPGKCPKAVPQRARTHTVTESGRPYRVLSAPARVHGRTYTVQLAASSKEFAELLEDFRWTLVWTLPLMLAVASAGGYWMSKRALAPVDRIIGTAEAMGAHNLSKRLEVPPSGDELTRLASTLNGLLERLETAFQRVTRFTADASHELRTPLALMRTTAELALRRTRSEAEYREALARILQETERTGELVENLLLLARADAGMAVELRPLDLRESLGEACSEVRVLARERELIFEEPAPGEPVTVAGDAPSLRRLFLILLDNAVKYTPPGGRIAVRLEAGPAVEVSDTGIGIAADDLPHIFERFYRADKARSREGAGAGLGLAIARRIADAHGAAIEARSTPGEGAIFRVVFKDYS